MTSSQPAPREDVPKVQVTKGGLSFLWHWQFLISGTHWTITFDVRLKKFLSRIDTLIDSFQHLDASILSTHPKYRDWDFRGQNRKLTMTEVQDTIKGWVERLLKNATTASNEPATHSILYNNFLAYLAKNACDFLDLVKALRHEVSHSFDGIASENRHKRSTFDFCRKILKFLFGTADFDDIFNPTLRSRP